MGRCGLPGAYRKNQVAGFAEASVGVAEREESENSLGFHRAREKAPEGGRGWAEQKGAESLLSSKPRLQCLLSLHNASLPGQKYDVQGQI